MGYYEFKQNYYFVNISRVFIMLKNNFFDAGKNIVLILLVLIVLVILN